jgi:hypothetical protein
VGDEDGQLDERGQQVGGTVEELEVPGDAGPRGRGQRQAHQHDRAHEREGDGVPGEFGPEGEPALQEEWRDRELRVGGNEDEDVAVPTVSEQPAGLSRGNRKMAWRNRVEKARPENPFGRQRAAAATRSFSSFWLTA